MFYARNHLDPDKSVYQYIPLDYFLTMLESKKYHVSLRQSFADKMEKVIALNALFPIQAVGENIPTQITILQQQSENVKHKSEEHSGYALLPASCWTHQESENIFMWDNYAQRIGVRVESSIRHMQSAFINLNMDCLFGNITYIPDTPSLTASDRLFIKQPAYRDEREIRFYLCHIQETDNNTFIEVPEPEAVHKDHVLIDVDPQNMIRNATLSPYFDKSVADKLAVWLNDEYGIPVRRSSISI